MAETDLFYMNSTLFPSEKEDRTLCEIFTIYYSEKQKLKM